MESHRRVDVARSIAQSVDLRALTDELVASLSRRTSGTRSPAIWRLPLLGLVRAHADLFVATLERGGEPSDDEVVALAREVRRCASDGLGLDDIERNHRAVSEVGLRHLAAHAGSARADAPGEAPPGGADLTA